jgi:hypothetical protein
MACKEWLEDRSVLYEMGKITKNREVYVHLTGGKAPKRKLYANGSKQMAYIINRLSTKGLGMKIGICSNVIDFKKLNPPLLKDMFASDWFLWERAVYKPNIGNPEIYLSKNLIWDIDAEGEPMKAFYQGEKVCAHLKGLGFDPMMVFSGSKGFHVWLNEKQSKGMVGDTFSDFKEDNAKFLAKAYCEVVKDVFAEATGEEFRGADLTPVERQGIIACPYSVHWKTGQIVWPLDERNLNTLRGLASDAQPIDIAKALHTQPNGQLWTTDLEFTDALLYFPPCNTVSKRGMPFWKGLDG